MRASQWGLATEVPSSPSPIMAGQLQKPGYWSITPKRAGGTVLYSSPVHSERVESRKDGRKRVNKVQYISTATLFTQGRDIRKVHTVLTFQDRGF